ncbi:MAG: alpha/beta fold hydrolase [Allosphingosinicella sp.]
MLHPLPRRQKPGFPTFRSPKSAAVLGANAAPGILPGIVDDLASYFRTRGIGKAAVIGHSMGGLVGMMFTRDHPDMVDRLMIVDSLPFFGMLFGPGASVESMRAGAEQLRTALLDGSAPTEAPATMSNSEAGRAQVTAWLRASDRAVVAQALYEDLLTDIRPTLAQVQTESTHVVYAVPAGAMAPVAGALYRDAYQTLPNATLVPVESSAHFIMLDQPEPFLAAVQAFLASAPPTG